MFIEALFVYCLRHNLDYEQQLVDMSFLVEENEELENLTKDLRFYRTFKTYKAVTLTDEEYELCVDKFGEEKPLL